MPLAMVKTNEEYVLFSELKMTLKKESELVYYTSPKLTSSAYIYCSNRTNFIKNMVNSCQY